MSPKHQNLPGETAALEPAGSASRFFISYSHADRYDREVATWLHDRLIEAGHAAFIDRDIPKGAEWSKEIDRRIEWCDWMIVLLSQHSIQSEMVIQEVAQARDLRRARQGRGERSRPGFLPIRVRYRSQRLGYQLDAYLGRFQHEHWRDKRDADRVLQAVIVAAGGELVEEEAGAGTPSPSPESDPVPAAPQPAADPRPSVPRGAIAAENRLYVDRESDALLVQLASMPSQMIAIKAPRQMGKTSSLQRYLAACEENGKRAVVVDLAIVYQPHFDSFPKLLESVMQEILRGLDRSEAMVPELTDQQAATHFLEDHVLADLTNNVVLAIDEADRVLGREYQTDFFAMFRVWQGLQQRSAAWRKLDVALVISTEPYLLIRSVRMSPFNVATIVELPAFTTKECQTLYHRWGGRLAPRDIHQLEQFFGGQPYLMQLAFFYLTRSDAVGVQDLMDKAAGGDGLFGEHLKALLYKLQSQAELAAAMKQIVRGKRSASDEDAARLMAAGLVRREGKRVLAANELYRKFFRGAL